MTLRTIRHALIFAAAVFGRHRQPAQPGAVFGEAGADGLRHRNVAVGIVRIVVIHEGAERDERDQGPPASVDEDAAAVTVDHDVARSAGPSAIVAALATDHPIPLQAGDVAVAFVEAWPACNDALVGEFAGTLGNVALVGELAGALSKAGLDAAGLRDGARRLVRLRHRTRRLGRLRDGACRLGRLCDRARRLGRLCDRARRLGRLRDAASRRPGARDSARRRGPDRSSSLLLLLRGETDCIVGVF